MLFKIFAIVLGIVSASEESGFKLKYAFELVRHGARAPMNTDPGFHRSQPQQLTPMGMRQRFLLGRYTFQKYSKSLGDQELLSKNGILMESTDVYRTILSGYSELQGMIFEQQPARLVLTDKALANL